MQTNCFHCGDPCEAEALKFDGKDFCCNGCKSVYSIFKENKLDFYYELTEAAGNSPELAAHKYDFLEDPKIVRDLLDFQSDDLAIINLVVPKVHCSSCIWILENLHRLHPAVLSVHVDFPNKKARIHYHAKQLSLKALVVLLSQIGYEPSLTLENVKEEKKPADRTLIYKLGVAGFAFGNIMFLSFPEYFESGEFWLERYKQLFRWIMFSFSLPVVFYAGSDYLTGAYKGLKNRMLNIDVPIALGILVLFLRSTLEITFDWGSGFFDSLSGLVFFLLLGKFFQQKTYAHLSFERDYRSYFPIGVTRINPDGTESPAAVHEIRTADRLLIRNASIIPVDSILLSKQAAIDYSFVSGESKPIKIQAGDKIYAGGKQTQGAIEIEALKPVSQSYLTQLWSDAAFKTDKNEGFLSLTNALGKRFTLAVLLIAFTASAIWLFLDASRALDVFTAVLIIACPCAIALAAPFALGNMLRILGRKRFYAKDTNTLERLSKINTIIFDKTGTLSTTHAQEIIYNGIPLTNSEANILKNTLRASGHPLSQMLYKELKSFDIVPLEHFQELPGRGVIGAGNGQTIKAGSADFISGKKENPAPGARVHISSADTYKGYYSIRNAYRKGIGKMLSHLSKSYEIALLSGDQEREKEVLENLLPPLTPMYFNQRPKEKLEFVKALQQNHKSVLMVGDGLNDAGALAQSEVGMAVSDNNNLFTPACDIILAGSALRHLHYFLKAIQKSIRVVRWSFFLSLLYNITGLYFAVSGQLEPVIAAILMPLSSISIVIFTTIATNRIGKSLPDPQD